MKSSIRRSTIFFGIALLMCSGNVSASPLNVSPLPATQDAWVGKVTLSPSTAVKKGRLVFAQDTAKYTAAGFQWPWLNVIGVRGSGYDTNKNVNAPAYNFVFNPRWSKENSILFQYGLSDSSSALYSIARWDTKSNKTETLLSNLHWKIVHESSLRRYLAYVRGGEPIAGRGGKVPASLCTLDLRTKTEKRWGEAEPLFSSVAWASDDTLLFSLTPSDDEQKAMRPTEANAKPLDWKPKIYAASVASGEVKTLVEDGQRPSPSLDGKWLLFLSSRDPSPPAPEAAPKIKPDPTLAQAKPDNALFLVLSRADGSEPRLVRSETRGAPNIIWFPDSSGFALCDTRFAGGAEGKTALSVAISRCEVKTLTPKRVGTFRYIAPVGTNMSEDERLWRPIAVTRDNRYLMSELTQFEAAPNNGLMLQRFDLQTGATETVAHIGSVRGLDWRE